MGKLTASINITADGFCGHTHVVADEEHHLFAADLLAGSSHVLLGRKTFELFESFWPQAEFDASLPSFMRSFAKKLNEMPKIIASRTLSEISWKNTAILFNADRDSVNNLKNSTPGTILMFGSPGLFSSLTSYGLIDEYWFSVQPFLAGHGIRLFDDFQLSQRSDLQLTDKRIFQSGVVNLRYLSIPIS